MSDLDSLMPLIFVLGDLMEGEDGCWLNGVGWIGLLRLPNSRYFAEGMLAHSRYCRTFAVGLRYRLRYKMNGHTFFLWVLMVIPCMLQATQVSMEWAEPLLSLSTNGSVQTNISDVRTNAQGDVFVIANYGSILSTDTSSFLGAKFTGAEYGNAASYNKNFLFTKCDSMGNMQWMIRSVEGNFSSGVFAPTSDGGAVMALKFNLTNRNQVKDTTASYMTLVDANGLKDSLTTQFDSINFSHIVLVKVAGDGSIAHVTPLWTSHAVAPANLKNRPTSDVADVKNITVDNEGNIYLVGMHAMDIALGTDTIRARVSAEWNGDSQNISSNCSSFIIKTDSTFKYLAHLSSTTTAKADCWNLSTCSGEKIYLVGNVRNQTIPTEVTWQLGDVSKTISNHAIAIACMDKSLKVNYVEMAEKNFVNERLAALSWSNDSSSLYVSGCIRGTMTAEGKSITAGNLSYDAMLLRIATATGKVQNMWALGGKANNIGIGAVTTDNDKVLLLGYGVTNSTIYLLTFSPELVKQDSTVLAYQKGMPSALGIARHNQTLWMAFRGANNIDYTIGNEVLNYSTKWYSVFSKWTLDNDASSVTDIFEDNSNSQKVLIDGQLYIRKGDKLYDVLGRIR